MASGRRWSPCIYPAWPHTLYFTVSLLAASTAVLRGEVRWPHSSLGAEHFPHPDVAAILFWNIARIHAMIDLIHAAEIFVLKLQRRMDGSAMAQARKNSQLSSPSEHLEHRRSSNTPIAHSRSDQLWICKQDQQYLRWFHESLLVRRIEVEWFRRWNLVCWPPVNGNESDSVRTTDLENIAQAQRIVFYAKGRISGWSRNPWKAVRYQSGSAHDQQRPTNRGR